MKPILFAPFGVEFPAYTTLLLTGFLVAVWLARREADRVGLPGEKIVDLGLAMLVAGIAGARILSVLTDGMLMDFVHLCTDPKLVRARDALVDTCTADAQCGFDYLCDLATHRCYPPRDCLAALKFWNGGLTYYGGLIAAVPAGLYLARRWKLGALRTADLVAPYLMIGLFFGRLGCFFNGCCYGAPTDSWVGVVFPPHPDRPHVPLHPVQLYEAVAVLAIAAVLYGVVRPRRRADGEVFGWMLALYAVWRFVVEFWRIDQRGGLGPLATSQWLSIPLAAAGGWLIWRARRASATIGA